MPYLVEAIGPGDRDLVTFRRRHQAEGQFVGRRAVALPVEIHVPAQLAVPPRILARHLIHLLRRARLDHHRRRHQRRLLAAVVVIVDDDAV